MKFVDGRLMRDDRVQIQYMGNYVSVMEQLVGHSNDPLYELLAEEGYGDEADERVLASGCTRTSPTRNSDKQ